MTGNRVREPDWRALCEEMAEAATQRPKPDPDRMQAALSNIVKKVARTQAIERIVNPIEATKGNPHEVEKETSGHTQGCAHS